MTDEKKSEEKKVKQDDISLPFIPCALCIDSGFSWTKSSLLTSKSFRSSLVCNFILFFSMFHSKKQTFETEEQLNSRLDSSRGDAICLLSLVSEQRYEITTVLTV